MSSLRDFLQAIRAMIARIHRSHVREQRLGRADVAGGFFTADVLLAGAKREAQSGVAASVLGHADEGGGARGCVRGVSWAPPAGRRGFCVLISSGGGKRAGGAPP